MKKSTILKSVSENLNIPIKEYEIFNQQLLDYEKSHQFATAEDLGKGIINDFPQLSLLHDAAMRRYARITASNSSTVKTIIVIFFICSIVAAIAMISTAK